MKSRRHASRTAMKMMRDYTRAADAAAVKLQGPSYTVVIGPSLVWIFPAPTGRYADRQEFETARATTPCPMCGKTGTITELPPPLQKIQPDHTTHVCFSGVGGCNHGFEVELP